MYSSFEELYMHLVCAGFKVSLSTNGLLLKQSVMKLFRDCPPLRLRVSLLGMTDESYINSGAPPVAKPVQANIDRVLAQGIPVKISFPIHHYTCKDGVGVADFCSRRSIGLDVFWRFLPRLDDTIDNRRCELSETDIHPLLTKMMEANPNVRCLSATPPLCPADTTSISCNPQGKFSRCLCSNVCPGSTLKGL